MDVFSPLIDSEIFRSLEEQLRTNPVEVTRFSTPYARSRRVPETGVIYPCHGMSAFAKYFHYLQLQRQPFVYGDPRPRKVCIRDDFVLLRFEPRKPLRAIVEEQLFSNPFFMQRLASFEKEAFDTLMRQMRKKPEELSDHDTYALTYWMLAYCHLSFSMIFQQSTLDTFIAASSLPDGAKKNISFALLSPPDETMAYLMIESHLLRLIYEHKNGSRDYSVEDFCEEIGYLNRSDIFSCDLEKPDHVHTVIKRRAPLYASAEEVHDERRHLAQEAMYARQRHHKAKEMLLQSLSAQQDMWEKAEAYLQFIALYMNYEERHRKTRTLFFRTIERWYHARGFDTKTYFPPFLLEQPDTDLEQKLSVAQK